MDPVTVRHRSGKTRVVTSPTQLVQAFNDGFVPPTTPQPAPQPPDVILDVVDTTPETDDDESPA